MNSWSRKDNYDDCEPCKKEKKQCPTILKCSPVGKTVTVPTTTPTIPVQLARVTVNIPDYCEPCAKIEYASSVGFLSTTPYAQVSADFTVEIFKNCQSMRTPLGSYSYSRSTPSISQAGTTGTITISGTISTTDSFTFFVCDCDRCPSECCYYSAEITNSAITSSATLPTVTVNNPALSALIVNKACDY